MAKTIFAILLGVALTAASIRGWDYYKNGVPAYTRAQWAMERADFRAALEHLAEAQQADPTDLRVVIDMAECFDRLGDRRTACALYREGEPLLLSATAPPGMRYHRERYDILRAMGY